MATTTEILIGTIALFTNTILIIVSYFVGNAVLGPFLDMAAKWNIHPLLKESMWENTYIFPAFFGMLLIFELLIIVGFVFILARRQVSPFDY